LATGIAIYRNQKMLTSRILDIVSRCARDTAPSLSERIVRVLYRFGEMNLSQIASKSRLNNETVFYRIKNLMALDLVLPSKKCVNGWRLNPALRELTRDSQVYREEEQHAHK
jgi:hypothetical protein